MVVALAVVGVGVGVIVARQEPEIGRNGNASGPNIVVIMTDDQSVASLSTMSQTQSLLVDHGTTFEAAVVSFPNCCPSRATYLTGQYAHNHRVTDNIGPHGGAFAFDESGALPVALQAAGYDTMHIGKYLNGWGFFGNIQPPTGWSSWFGLIDPSTYQYVGYSVSNNGERVDFPTDDDSYQTDILAAEAVRYIREAAPEGRPFFLSFTPLAPHVAAPEGAAAVGDDFPLPVAPARYANRFDGVPLPRGPAYNEQDVADKPSQMRLPPLSPETERYLEQWWRAELGALAAVDDAVASIVGALSETDQLDRTVLIFTSDNGLFRGEHRIPFGKVLLYEPSVRVPLVVRGGGFLAGARVETPVSNVDLAPTIGDLAGAELADEPDGVSLIDVVEAADELDRAVLLENFVSGQANARGVRTRRWSYIQHPGGDRELYDLDGDPHQLDNRAGEASVASVETTLAELLSVLRDCRGASCQVPLPAAIRD